MKLLFLSISLTLVVLLTTQNAHATTWGPEKVVCPLCGTRNDFHGIRSYGSYIYWRPSKFQYVFWPYTVSAVLYSCKSCHLTCFMSDFKDVPVDKHNRLREMLSSVEVEGNPSVYTDIPMLTRLRIAERVYSVLKEGDDEFWCKFYRILGYHCANQGRHEEAQEARKKALVMTAKMLSEDKNAGIQKELFVIAGTMLSALEDYAGAATCFRKTQTVKYENPDLEAEHSEDFDKYLTELSGECLEKIKDFPSVAAVMEKDADLLPDVLSDYVFLRIGMYEHARRNVVEDTIHVVSTMCLLGLFIFAVVYWHVRRSRESMQANKSK